MVQATTLGESAATAAGSPAAERRAHTIVLCCARSVQGMVEEVARNLRGMGFPTDVVCGAQARNALLADGSTEPMIYVICVQGTLKETVLKPLRQALAARGRPNAHLFVAVLDLSLPLSMVGQIRRFAETLERAPLGINPPRADKLGDRRQWRQVMGPHQRKRYATRNYRTLRSMERTRARADSGSTAALRTGPRRLVTDRKPARIEATKKYRAVTGPRPKLEPRPVTKSEVAPLRRVIAVPSPDPEPKDAIEAEMSMPQVAARRTTQAWLLVGSVAALAAGFWWWTGGDSKAEATSGTTPNLARTDDGPHEAPPRKVAPPPERGAAEVPSTPGPPTATDDSGASDVPPPESGTKTDSPGQQPNAQTEVSDSEPDAPVEPAPAAPDEPADAATVAARLGPLVGTTGLRQTDAMYLVRRENETTTWSAARRSCSDFELEGVSGWRLPYRRELKLLGAIGLLPDGVYWSGSDLDEDPDFVFVYDAQRRELATWLKTEPTARRVCVRRK